MYTVYGNYGSGAGLYVLFHIIWIIIVVVAIVWIIRMLAGGPHRFHDRMERMQNWHGRHHGGEKTALDILKERYAKGEINKEEFDAKKNDLL